MKGGGLKNVIIRSSVDNLHLVPSKSELAQVDFKSYRKKNDAKILSKAIEDIRRTTNHHLMRRILIYFEKLKSLL